MPLIDTNHQRAALLVLLLGLALVIALTPYATGLIGCPVLSAVSAPGREWLSLRARPKVAASLVVVLALFLIVVPGVKQREHDYQARGDLGPGPQRQSGPTDHRERR